MNKTKKTILATALCTTTAFGSAAYAANIPDLSPQDLANYLATNELSDEQFAEIINSDALSAEDLAEIYEESRYKVSVERSELIRAQYESKFSGDGAKSGSISGTTYVLGGLGVLGLAAMAAGGGGGDDSAPANNQSGESPSGGSSNVFKDNEYARMGGQDLVSLRTMHDRGYTGKNAVLAIMDSGVLSTHEDLIGSFAGFYNPATGEETASSVIDVVGHGTHVAGIVGANQNDKYVVGYAPDADLLVVKATDDSGRFVLTDQQEANAYGWARVNGADFINSSWGVDDTTDTVDAVDIMNTMPTLLTEFQYGSQNDVVYVWANGNNGTDQPSVYAALPELFPELKDNWVAVANVGNDGLLHWSSQACGRAAEWCISAPGENITSTSNMYVNGTNVKTGTSMSSPAVTGALGSLKDRFPMLSNAQIVDRLFLTANKSGVYADSTIYGQGLMDLDAASAPIGNVTVTSLDGSKSTVKESSMVVSGAFGSSKALQGVQVMGLDDQGAGFLFDLGDLVVTSDQGYDAAQAKENLSTKGLSSKRTMGNAEIRFDSSQTGSDISTKNIVMSINGENGDSVTLAQVSKADMIFGEDNLSGKTQQSVSFTAPFWVQSSFGEDSERELISGIKQDVEFDGFGLSVTALSASDRRGVSAKLITEITPAYSLSLDVGAIQGSDGLFGSKGTGALSLGDSSVTRFVGIGGQGKIGSVNVYHNFYVGETKANVSGGLINSMDPIVSSSWLAGMHVEDGGQRLGFLVAQPLKVEAAKAGLSYVSGYQGGAFTKAETKLDLAPSGRQINSEIFYGITGEDSEIKMSLMRIDNPGHNSESTTDHAFLLSYSKTF